MDKKNFFIPQIEEDKTEGKENTSNQQEKPKKENYQTEKFVSPIFGTRVKDKDYYPTYSYQNGGKQYDSFRDPDKKQRQDDYKDYVIDPKTIYQGSSNSSSQSYANSMRNSNSDSSYVIPVTNPYLDDNDNNNNSDNLYHIPNTNQNANTQEFENNDIREEEPYPEEPKKEYHDIFAEEENYNSYDEEEIEEDGDEDNYSPYAKKFEEEKAPKVQYRESSSKQVKPKLEKKQKYFYPPVSLLSHKDAASVDDMSGVQRQRDIIDQTLNQFGIGGRVVRFTKGPTVTLFEFQVDPGVRYSKIPQLQNNLQGNLEALSIRIQAPIPGKATVGIEVPNIKRDTVLFGDLVSDEFLNDGNPINVVLGQDIAGEPVYLNIQKMPHGLIAGSTGSGKSVCINCIITSILYKAHPDDVKLILIDPKKVEFAKYQGIPHLACPIINDNKLAAAALKWAVDEMEARYETIAAAGAVNYLEYLDLIGATKEYKHMPYIVIIIDEMADLMLSGADVEDSIARLTAKARAAGIHLIVSTQRPSVNVINGTIKTNIPSRIAFKVNKALDSNIILDHVGAEKLLGNGDMLYDEDNGRQRRLQGSYISTREIKDVVGYIEDNYTAEFLFDTDELSKRVQSGIPGEEDASTDDLFDSIARYIVSTQNASINNIQKKFGCGFNRVQSIVQKLEELGVVGANVGSRARTVLMQEDDLEEVLQSLK
ncbi:MAG: DNA translocase FtsK [Bacilli bacterium]|nr:DNA translocase FtsK [Bacilli bacterium]